MRTRMIIAACPHELWRITPAGSLTLLRCRLFGHDWTSCGEQARGRPYREHYVRWCHRCDRQERDS